MSNQNTEHTRDAPYQPTNPEQIDRYHRVMRNMVKLERHYFPWGWEQAIAERADHYNQERHQEPRDNLAQADASEERSNAILD